MRTIVLASASPRRRDLIAQLGLSVDILPANIDESIFDGLPPRETALALAKAKAALIARRRPDALVIGADTVVAQGERMFGKPQDPVEARSMLTTLSGAMHSVWTGLAVMDGADGRIESDATETKVFFKSIPEPALAAYIHSPEPYDKAGAYGIQGDAGQFVDHIEGDYFNVVGLPLKALVTLLRRFKTMPNPTFPTPPPPLQERPH